MLSPKNCLNMENQTICIKVKKKNKDDILLYMHQFVDAAIRMGVVPVFGKNRKFVRLHLCRIVQIIPIFKYSSQKIIIASRGSDILSDSWPYWGKEIIPMLWDSWPVYHKKLFYYLKKLKCKIVFVTTRSVAEKINKELGIKAYWIPEGVDITRFKNTKRLKARNIDVYELGRQHPVIHSTILELAKNGVIKYIGNTYLSDGTIKYAFPSTESFYDQLDNIKIVVNFPRHDTAPASSPVEETLTQRYWECMLSGCLMIGRSPQELIDLIGYNPVINIDLSSPSVLDGSWIKQLIANVDHYQDLVDRNFQTALLFASWDNRASQIIDIIKNGSRNE